MNTRMRCLKVALQLRCSTHGQCKVLHAAVAWMSLIAFRHRVAIFGRGPARQHQGYRFPPICQGLHRYLRACGKGGCNTGDISKSIPWL